MKTKSLNKKLVLNKKTVADLDKNEMSTAKGGYGDRYYTKPLTCNTDDPVCTDFQYCEDMRTLPCIQY